MEVNENVLIKLLNDSDNIDLIINQLVAYRDKISEEKQLSPKTSVLRQELSCLLISRLLQSSNVVFVNIALGILRYMSRDKDVVTKHMTSPIFVKFLCAFGEFDLEEPVVVKVEKNEEIEANCCRCLCNLLFLSRDGGQIKLCSNARFIKSIVTKVSKHESKLHEQNKLSLRLLFLVAALSNEGREMLIDSYDARKVGIDFLSHVLSSNDHPQSARSLSVDDTEMCCEILKVIFYLNMDLRRKAMHTQQELNELDSLIELCSTILLSTSSDKSLNESLHCNAGNALYSVPPACFNMKKLIGDPTEGVHLDPVIVLLNILRSRVMNNLISNDILHPLLALFSQLCRLSREIRVFAKQEILPPRKDFRRRPEEGEELRHKLIKLFTHNNTDLKHGAADFIFVLCKEKVDRFVKYTGYGNAAGLLALRGLLAGGQGETIYSDTDSDSDTEEYKEVCDRVNPVTGNVPPERPNPMEGMSEEQKEYLAVQLANEFSKLSSDDILQPMCVGEDGKLVSFQQKVHETKIEEPADSSDDD